MACLSLAPKYLDGSDKHFVSPLFYDDLKRVGLPWVRKDVQSENYPRCELVGQSWINEKGMQVTQKYYHYMWAGFYDAERRLANETRQNLANNCKENGCITRLV